MKFLENIIIKKIIKLDKLDININPEIKFKFGDFLFDLILKYKLYNIISIGLGYGINNIFMSQALEKIYHEQLFDKGIIINIDPNQRKFFGNIGIENIKRTDNLKFFKFITENPDIYINKLYKKEGKKQYDLILLNMNYLLTKDIICNSIKLLKKGGYLIFSDIKHPYVRNLINFITNNIKVLHQLSSYKGLFIKK